jgi:hypothetical protein
MCLDLTEPSSSLSWKGEKKPRDKSLISHADLRMVIQGHEYAHGGPQVPFMSPPAQAGQQPVSLPPPSN